MQPDDDGQCTGVGYVALSDHASRNRALKLHMHDGSLADARPWRSLGSHGNLFVDSKLVVREIASSDMHTIMDKQVPSMHLLESLRQADKSRWEDYYYHKLCTVLKAAKSLKAKLVEDVDDASDCGTYVSDGEDDDWLDDHADGKPNALASASVQCKNSRASAPTSKSVSDQCKNPTNKKASDPAPKPV